MAGSWTSLITFVVTCVGWVSTYVYRVATKVSEAAVHGFVWLAVLKTVTLFGGSHTVWWRPVLGFPLQSDPLHVCV